MLSISVYINAHLKGEFCLTYAGMGPTEFRLIMMVVNTLFATIAPLREWTVCFDVFDTPIALGAFDIAGLIILVVLVAIYLDNFYRDLKGYEEIDPVKPY
jgi:hypothetical protein